jgi:mannobiose 2-epimerase
MLLVNKDIQPDLLFRYKAELTEELTDILSYWMKYTIDRSGGFYGSVNNCNTPDEAAVKGVVLNSRILWAFSAAYQVTKNLSHYKTAQRAYDYILKHFIDREFGGVYWSVDANGNMLDVRKQMYGLAFCIYGLSEYYKISNEQQAIDAAIDLYNYIERYSFDKDQNGYIEAFTREWTAISDLRLSEKDNNERKTMNTHLHIVEAYVNLYSIWPDTGLKEKISNLLFLFDRFFVNSTNYHLNLFFDDNWKLKSSLQSYGHDIEAAWLLQQCAEIIKDEKWMDQFRQHAVPITEAAAEGLDTDGGLWYEYELGNDRLIREKHSWPQAEAMIGFYNAYQLTGNERYLQRSLHCWEFVKKYIKDKENGEWFWGVTSDYTVMQKEKAGFWKCPYHNTRACIELLKRIN